MRCAAAIRRRSSHRLPTPPGHRGPPPESICLGPVAAHRRSRASLSPFPRLPLVVSRASPSSFPRRREPSVAVTHIPTKVANKSHHPGRRLPPFPRPLRRPRVRRPLHDSSFPAPRPRRSREGGNPAQPSLAYQPRLPTAPTPVAHSHRFHAPSVVPAYGDLCMTRRFPRLPLVVPAKAGTQRNRHSHTNQGCQQPPPLVAALGPSPWRARTRRGVGAALS